MKKNILFISSWYPNKLEPTNGNFVQRHAEAASLLNNVEVLHTIGDFNQKEKFIFEEEIINGIRTIIVYYKNSKNPIKNFFRRMKAYKLGFQKLQKPDLVHANVLHNNMLFAVYFKKKYKIPFVVTEHWTALQIDNLKKTPYKVKKIAHFIGNQASYILPVSDNLLKSLAQLSIKTPKKIITNVVDTEIFNLGNIDNSIPKFLHISSLIPRKKADRIIATAVKLHEQGFHFNLDIGGDGDYKILKKQIENLNAQDYIKTFGALTYDEVAEKMKTSDCFILFSENETQGCVILESYACGIPVISTAVGGVPEFVKDNFGILIEKNNEEELLQAMKYFLENKTKFYSKQELRKYCVDNFSKLKIAEQFSEIYNKVLTK